MSNNSLDIRSYTVGEAIAVSTTTGETFSGVVISTEENTSGSIEVEFLGPWWEQINDRVDSRTLVLTQNVDGDDGIEQPTLSGFVTENLPTLQEEYKILGQVEDIWSNGANKEELFRD